MQREQISSSLLLFSIGCFIQGSTPLTSFLSSTAKKDAWIVVITGFIVSLPIIWMYTALAAKFPGKSLIKINDIVFGKILGKVFSAFYVFFFFSLCFLNINQLNGFISSSLLPETPNLAICLLFVFMCGWAARSGAEGIMRCSFLFIFITYAISILNTLLLWKNMKLVNLKPSFTLPFIKYVQGTLTASALPFCEIIAFLMFMPSLKDLQNVKKSFFVGLCIGGLTLLIVEIRNISVLGPTIHVLSNPNFEAIKLINIGDIITRMETLYAIVLITLIFFKVSVLFYVTVKAIEEMLNLNSYQMLVPSIGALIICFTMIAFNSSVEHAYWGKGPASFYSLFFEAVLPTITFVAAMIRFRKGREVSK
ncbi:MAG: endospore germination permease [Clostridia bacterium]|nr:endospore germination permease [Clostridia bacterium]